MFIWTMINTVLVYFQFGQEMTHWICFFSAFLLFPAIFDALDFKMERLHSSIFRLCPDCILNSSFSTKAPWDFHLNFCSEIIKPNFKQHNWRRMYKKRSKAFIDFWVVFLYFYVLPLNKNWLNDVLILCHTWITDSFSELTLFLFRFMGSD